MVKTVLKIDGMMCGMCEAHMNELIRKNFKVKKVTSSAKDGETVIFSDAELDIPWAKKQIKDIGYEMVDYISGFKNKIVIAFVSANTKGTRNTSSLAKRANIRVIEREYIVTNKP